MNKVTIMGRLGQDPELRYTPNGQAVCNFSVATTERWKDDQGKPQERTEWHRIVVWGKSGENCAKFLRKGGRALIEGSLQTRSWEKDGVTHYMTEIKSSHVEFIDFAGDQAGDNQVSHQNQSYGTGGRQQSSQQRGGQRQAPPQQHNFDIQTPYPAPDLDQIPF